MPSWPIRRTLVPWKRTLLVFLLAVLVAYWGQQA